jgi:hypothetical protein
MIAIASRYKAYRISYLLKESDRWEWPTAH